MKRMGKNVLIVDSWRAFGGGERFALDLVEELRSRGLAVSLACVSQELARRAAGQGAQVGRLPLVIRQNSHFLFVLQLLSLPIACLAHLRLFFRLGRPDTVHLVTFEEQQLFTVLYLLLGERVTWSVHGHPSIRNRVQQWLYRHSANRSSGIVAVSSNVAESLLGHGVAECQIQVVRHGVDTPACPPRSGPTSGTDCVLAGFVGRLEEIKDPGLFVDVADWVGGDRGIEFAIYGAGSLGAVLQNNISQRALKHVTMAGYEPDVDVIYRSLDLLVVTSVSEGLGYSLLEAGANGLPCVVPDLPVMREVIVDGRTGLICDRNPAALGEAVLRLASDKLLRESMGRAARAHIAANFSRKRASAAAASVVVGYALEDQR